MSSINTKNITSENATITNLYVQTINGISASRFGKCCSCQDICQEDDGVCPNCQSYEDCDCQDDDGVCPDCLPFDQCNCNCHNTGPTGAQGFQGVTGAQGFQGVTGAQGFQGVTGAQGFQGVTGAQGFQGVTGFQGDTGAQGFQGDTGTTGAQGFQGATGTTGAQGFQGATGPTGAQGFQGVTGAQGFQGVTGAQGFQGATGTTGAQGFQGATGPTGAQGFQGATGPTGAQGFQGATGKIGPSFASSSLNYYFDLESGGYTGTLGPGYTISTQIISGSPTTVAFIYPLNIYFNEDAGGSVPWTYTTGVANNSYYTINSQIFYKMPYNGTISGVSVNNLTWFTTNAKLDIIIADGTSSVLTSSGLGLPDFTTVTFPISGYTQTISNPSFNAGDGLACVIKNPGGTWVLPFAPQNGIVFVTLYVKFTS